MFPFSIKLIDPKEKKKIGLDYHLYDPMSDWIQLNQTLPFIFKKKNKQNRLGQKERKLLVRQANLQLSLLKHLKRNKIENCI